MRISFLAVVAVALLVGLGVVVAVKALGLLAPPVVAVPPPPPPPAPLPAVLVFVRPIFPGDAINPSDVNARTILPSEREYYESHKDELLPPIREGVYYRSTNKTIEANRPVRKDDLAPAEKPKPLRDRLLPGTRAVNVSLPKDSSAGGLIQVGDWVDVWLNTSVARVDDPTPVRRSGLLAKNAQVVAKRDNLYQIYAPQPGDSVPFTLGLNPYRAALVEYGRTVGTVSLEPVSDVERARLDKVREDALKDPTKASAIVYGDGDTRDGRIEQERVDAYNKGELAVGAEDLVRVMQLQPVERRVAPPPVRVEVLHGAGGSSRTLSFPVAGGPIFDGGYGGAVGGYLFSAPGGAGYGGGGSSGGVGGSSGGGSTGRSTTTANQGAMSSTNVGPRQRRILQPDPNAQGGVNTFPHVVPVVPGR